MFSEMLLVKKTTMNVHVVQKKTPKHVPQIFNFSALKR